MGCLSRVGCLVVVAGAAAAGYWLYGDQLPSKLATAAGRAADKASEAAGAVADRSRGTRRDSTIGTARDTNRDTTRDTNRRDSNGNNRGVEPRVDWVSLGRSASMPTSDVAALSKRDGPAFVTLTAAELAGLFSSVLPKQLPTSARDIQLAMRDNQLLVRATLDVAEIAGDGTLGRVLGIALAGRDTLQLGGTLEPLRPGVAQYRIESLRVKGMDVPPRLIPTMLGALRRGQTPKELAPNGVGMLLPKAVADLRVANGRLTLYKAVR